MRNVAYVFAVLLAVGLCGRVAAEDDSWGSDEAKTKEIRLTLVSGEVIQGRFSADTKDKVMLSVITPKGKNMQSVKKDDVKKHEWVKPMEDEFRAKMDTFPADKFEDMLTYAQTMVDKGYKKPYLDIMKDKQKDLTAHNFKLYVFNLINNECEHEAKDLIDWAKQEHPDWKDDIAAAVDRLPHANKLSDPGPTGTAATTPTTLAPGMVPCAAKIPSNKEMTEYWLDDAKKHLGEASKVDFLAFNAYDQSDPDVIAMTVGANFDAKVTGGKNTRYTVVLVYTRRAPGVFSFKETLLAPWGTFPKPIN